MHYALLAALFAVDLAGLVEQMQQLKKAGDEAAVARLAPIVRAELEHNQGPFTALAWNQLGIYHGSREEFGEAERAYRRAIKIAEIKDQKGVLSLALTNLAQHYLASGRPAQAEVLLRQALSLATARVGSESPELTNFLASLAAARQMLGDFKGASSYYEQSLALTSDYPQGKLTRGYILANLAALRAEEKNWSGSRDALEESLALIERSLGATHPDLIAPSVSLAEVHIHFRQWDKANALLDRAAGITGVRFGGRHRRMAEVLIARASILRQTGHRAEAKKLEARAKAIRAEQPRNPSGDAVIHVSDLIRK